MYDHMKNGRSKKDYRLDWIGRSGGAGRGGGDGRVWPCNKRIIFCYIFAHFVSLSLSFYRGLDITIFSHIIIYY